MSKEVNIADKTYYYDCNAKVETIEFLLYDFNETWKATKTKEEVLQTLQLLNKRIKYDVAIAFDTLQNALPESGTWIGNDNQPEASNARERVLKLKYRVKECPFHFEWRLKQDNSPLTIQLPIGQVASLVDVLPAKIEELLEILQRKEAEIKQYRREYGSLRRSTLATNDFDMAVFREQYAAADVSVKSLQRAVARWRSEHGDAECELETLYNKTSSPTIIIKKEEPKTSASSASKSVQESPRSRKRKALHSYKTQMMRSLQSGTKDLQYESQSQSLSENEQEDIRTVKKMRGNDVDVDNVIVDEVITGKSVNTPSKLKAAEKPTKAPANPIVKDSSTAAKEVASKAKKASPSVEKRPNTRQRRRECEMGDLNSTELEFVDTAGGCVSPVLNKSVALAKQPTTTKTISPPSNNNVQRKIVNSTTTKTISSQKVHNMQNKIVTSAQKLVKPHLVKPVEQLKNDLSSYVDSMLSQLEALDKELRG
ncbi:uncharacterized protein LOC120775415 isoform X1 [Bactrocera tryoni]|uniref:uncharacterized protein LOC120775415 isoform X1 n=1 Tax=Bactrocera tryoni TaxID=59916 RepID=UPI001A995A9A|nr:uncharacterized protein LOC120775415 isoform X1 [Bactrocera tryoni]